MNGARVAVATKLQGVPDYDSLNIYNYAEIGEEGEEATPRNCRLENERGA